MAKGGRSPPGRGRAQSECATYPPPIFDVVMARRPPRLVDASRVPSSQVTPARARKMGSGTGTAKEGWKPIPPICRDELRSVLNKLHAHGSFCERPALD